MKDQLIVWEAGRHLGRKYEIERIEDGPNGLTIRLINVDKDERLILTYNVAVCAYKSVNESFWIDSLEKLEEIYGASLITSHTFFEVRASSYAKEIERGSCGAVKAAHVFHLKIIAGNAILDVVSFGAPILELERHS